jgi:hypothetical protein
MLSDCAIDLSARDRSSAIMIETTSYLSDINSLTWLIMEYHHISIIIIAVLWIP